MQQKIPEKLYFATAGIPVFTKPRTYEAAFEDLISLGLDGMEVEFVHGVNMNSTTQQDVKKLASEKKLILTAHGPYYINLNAQEEDKMQASVKRILDTARVASAFGGYSITFHAAFYMGKDKNEVFKTVKKKMDEITETLKKENIKIWVRPEITGKATQWGDLDEIIKLSKENDMVLPCIDFAHMHARYNGKYNSYGEFAYIFEKIGKELGDNALKNFHAHVEGINYGPKGEKNHLMLNESDFNYKDLLKAFKAFDVKGALICESPIMEDDAVMLKKEYLSL